MYVQQYYDQTTEKKYSDDPEGNLVTLCATCVSWAKPNELEFAAAEDDLVCEICHAINDDEHTDMRDLDLHDADSGLRNGVSLSIEQTEAYGLFRATTSAGLQGHVIAIEKSTLQYLVQVVCEGFEATVAIADLRKLMNSPLWKEN